MSSVGNLQLSVEKLQLSEIVPLYVFYPQRRCSWGIYSTSSGDTYPFLRQQIL